jgi:hypothetical protein
VDDPATLLRMVNGYQASRAIHVAATLGIADLLADGPRTSDDLAAATESHPDALYRVLRALASIGIFREEDGGLFALTPLGEGLRADALQGWAAFVGRPYHWQAWSALEDSVRTGENAFRMVHGTDPWEYRATRPEESALFDRAMTALTRPLNGALLDAYDFGRFAKLMDVGGGTGALLAAVLAEYPALQGVLFDQPHVVAGAEALLGAAGVADRCRVVAGSFFEAVPEGADAHVLKSVIHDWEDEEATAILRTCRRALEPDGAVLVVERVLAPPNEGPEAKFVDLTMLVMTGGRERTLDEYAALFEAAGLRLAGATPTGAGFSVLEAAPAL